MIPKENRSEKVRNVCFIISAVGNTWSLPTGIMRVDTSVAIEVWCEVMSLAGLSSKTLETTLR